jgi:hypothetical protein
MLAIANRAMTQKLVLVLVLVLVLENRHEA